MYEQIALRIDTCIIFIATLHLKLMDITGVGALQTIVKKWGNSASVRIPAPVMAAVAIDVHQTVDVRAEDGRIVIEPVRAPLYDLDDLLAGMTPETFPEAVEFGAPVGEEAW